MPFRHVAMYRWAEHVDTDHVRRVSDAYDRLAEQVVGLRHHAHGSDVGVSEGTFDFHVVADFETVAEWRRYRDHPAHVLLVEELITGYVAERASGQFQAPDDRRALNSTRPSSRTAEPEDMTDPSIRDDESDEELLARARRAAMAEMQTLLAEPDDPA